ncbi:MAG: hypothetical protein U0531_14585 [Dehalococcoidia bacterium]
MMGAEAMTTLSQILAQEMRRHSLKWDDLAQRLGMSRVRLQALMAGRHTWDPSKSRKLWLEISRVLALNAETTNLILADAGLPPLSTEETQRLNEAREQQIAPETAPVEQAGKLLGFLPSASSDEARRLLARVGAALRLDTAILGLMFGVSAEVVEGWLRGQEPVPPPVQDRLRGAVEALARLEAAFLPERLPDVIRRPAPIFDGQSALDWILAGRIAEVADRYDRLLQYQA